GQPARPRVRLEICARHSWPFLHFHQTARVGPIVTSWGVSGAFFVGCHSAAIAGASAAIEFVTEARLPRQKGQPVPFTARVYGVSSDSWSGPFGHFHQTLRSEPTATRRGRSSPFFLGCHCFATPGAKVAKEFVTEARRPEQNGQPVPCTRWLTAASHTW